MTINIVKNITFDVLLIRKKEGLHYKSRTENREFSMNRDGSESLLYNHRAGSYQLIGSWPSRCHSSVRRGLPYCYWLKARPRLHRLAKPAAGETGNCQKSIYTLFGRSRWPHPLLFANHAQEFTVL